MGLKTEPLLRKSATLDNLLSTILRKLLIWQIQRLMEKCNLAVG